MKKVCSLLSICLLFCACGKSEAPVKKSESKTDAKSVSKVTPKPVPKKIKKVPTENELLKALAKDIDEQLKSQNVKRIIIPAFIEGKSKSQYSQRISEKFYAKFRGDYILVDFDESLEVANFVNDLEMKSKLPKADAICFGTVYRGQDYYELSVKILSLEDSSILARGMAEIEAKSRIGAAIRVAKLPAKTIEAPVENKPEKKDPVAAKTDTPVVKKLVVENKLRPFYIALRDNAWLVRYRAIEALQRDGSENAKKIIAEYSITERHDRVISHLINTLLAYQMREEALALSNRLLEDANPRIRVIAIQSLQKIGGKKALVLVKKVLRDFKPEVRKAAINAVSAMGAFDTEEKSVDVDEKKPVDAGNDPMALALIDTSYRVRNNAVKNLQKIGDKKSKATLTKYMKYEKDERVIRQYVSTLLALGMKDENFEFCRSALSNPVWLSRYRAIIGLYRMGDKRSKDVLVKYIKTLKNEEDIRHLIDIFLTWKMNKEALDLSKRMVTSPVARSRRLVIDSLVKIGSTEAQNVIIIFLKDTDKDVVSSAERNLKRFIGAATISQISKLFNDNYYLARNRAIDALWNIKSSGAKTALLYALKSEKDERVIKHLKNTLKKWPGAANTRVTKKSNQEVIIQHLENLESKSHHERGLAREALNKMEVKKIKPILVKLLKNKNNKIRYLAARILQELLGEKAITYLSKGLKDKDDQVRYSAISSLNKIGGSKAKSILEKHSKIEKHAVVLPHINAVIRRWKK